MDEAQCARYEAEARRAEAMVFWGDFFKILGILVSSWQTYVIAIVVWGLVKIF